MNDSPRNPAPEESWTLGNEFAHVRVSLDRRGHDARVRIDDLSNETTVLLDAFQLAALAGLTGEQFAAFMDPGRRP